jgi:hypothetical protein
MLQVSRRRRDLTGVPDSVTEAQPGVGGPESLFGSGLGRRSTMERDLQPARRIRSPSVPPAASHQPANECRSWADAAQAGRPRRPARRPGRRPRSHRAVAARAGPGEHRHYADPLLASLRAAGGSGLSGWVRPMAIPTGARPARPSGAALLGARPAPLRPPQPAGPLPPAPPPGPEPPSESSPTTRHPPGRPAPRRALAGSAWVPVYPRCRPSPAACSHPLALLGSARLAASRLASPCSARRACRRRRVAADPVAAGGVGGWAASQASTAATASVCSCARRRPASPPSSCTSYVNPGGPGRARRPRLLWRWPAAGSRGAGLRGGLGLGLSMHGSLLARPRRLAPPAESTAELHGWKAVGSVAPDSDRVSITLIRAFTRPRAPKPQGACSTTTIQRRGCGAAWH